MTERSHKSIRRIIDRLLLDVARIICVHESDAFRINSGVSGAITLIELPYFKINLSLPESASAYMHFVFPRLQV